MSPGKPVPNPKVGAGMVSPSIWAGWEMGWAALRRQHAGWPWLLAGAEGLRSAHPFGSQTLLSREAAQSHKAIKVPAFRLGMFKALCK